MCCYLVIKIKRALLERVEPSQGYLAIHTVALVRDEAHLGQQVARAVDDLRLSSEAIDTLDEAVQLHHACHTVKVPQVICHAISCQADEDVKTFHFGGQRGKELP